MSALHDEAIEQAARVLGLGEELEYDFGSAERAHKEYMSFKRALNKKGRTPAVEALTVSRSDCLVRIRMDTPRHLFPTPVKKEVTVVGRGREQENEKKGEKYNPEVERILTLAKEDLEEGMITKEEYDGIMQQYSAEEEN